MGSRIVHLVNELVDTGNGIVNVTVDLAVEQARSGDRVTVASSGGGFVSLLAEYGVRHVEIDFRSHPLRSAGALAELVREERPDVVHAHTVAPCLLAAAVRRVPGVPRFVLVATMHNVYQRSAPLMATADMTVGVADAVTDTVRGFRWHSPLVETVANGVVGSPRRARHASSTTEAGTAPDLGGTSIVTVGAVSHRKGADILLDAFESLAPSRPDLHLWYLGNKDWAEFVERAERSRFADRVHLTGLSDRPQAYLEAATVVAVPSRREGLALSLLEAREVGAAIVACETDGAREGLDDGASGILVPVGDPVALALALAAVLDDPAAREDLRARSAAGLDRFSVSRMARDYRDRYAAAARGSN